jgi:hypothetical protein
MRQIINAYIIFGGKPEGKRTLGIPKHSWEDNIKMVLAVTMLDCVDWVGTSEHLWVS